MRALKAREKRMLTEGADVSAFQKYVGQIETVERQWYDHVIALKRNLADGVTPSVKWEIRRAVDETAERESEE